MKDKTTERIIGARIQRLRKEKGYTQQAFAEMIGLSTNYLSDIERGKSSARLDKFVAIINTLECSADDVFIDVIQYRNRIKASRLSEAIETLPPEEQEKIFEIIEVFTKRTK